MAEWNHALEERVGEQVALVDRLGRLKRFFSPQLAELIVAGGADDPLHTHRREVTVCFVDLRGFTAFAETVEPEEVMAVLREYHAEMGRLVLAHEGTLERFTGDGMMVFFNDPVPVPNPGERVVRLAIEMRECVAPADRAVAPASATSSIWVSASPRASRRSERSALKDAGTTARSVQSRTSQRAFAAKLRRVRR